MLTQERLKELLKYNPDTGVFTRRVTSKGRGHKVGTLDHTGYVHIKVDYNNYLEHRLAWLYMYGDFPPEMIDHIDHDKTNSRIKNLRAVSRKENCRNLGIAKSNKSGVIGVSWINRDKRWVAKIASDKGRVTLGYFRDFFEATCSRKSAEIKYNYHVNHGKLLTT